MQLSLLFIMNKLSDYQITCKVESDTSLRFSCCQLISKDQSIYPSTNCLYITSENGPALSNPQVTGIVWVHPQIKPPTSKPALWVHAHSTELIPLFNQLIQLFNFFNHWGSSVSQALLETQPLDTIFTLLQQVTPNPYYFCDSSFRMLSIKKDAEMEEMSYNWKFQYYHKYLPMETIMKLTNSGELLAMNQNDTAVIVPIGTFVMPFVSRTIFSNQGILGHFYIIGAYERLNQCDIEIANYFGEQLSKMLNQKHDYLPSSGNYYEHFFSAFLSGNPQNPERTDDVLSSLSWGKLDVYTIAVIQPRHYSDETIWNPAKYILINELEERRSFLKILPFEQKLVAIINLTHMTPVISLGDNKEIREQIKRIFQRSNIVVGCSEPFRNFEKIRDFHKQALCSLALGLSTEEKQNVHHYHRYAMIDIAHTLKNTIPLDSLFPFGVKCLLEYDCQHKSEYTYTLYCFLHHNQSVLDTSNALHLHRNSIMYRLDRIQEIASIRFDDPQECLRINIGLYIYFSDQSRY